MKKFDIGFYKLSEYCRPHKLTEPYPEIDYIKVSLVEGLFWNFLHFQFFKFCMVISWWHNKTPKWYQAMQDEREIENQKRLKQ